MGQWLKYFAAGVNGTLLAFTFANVDAFPMKKKYFALVTGAFTFMLAMSLTGALFGRLDSEQPTVKIQQHKHSTDGAPIYATGQNGEDVNRRRLGAAAEVRMFPSERCYDRYDNKVKEEEGDQPEDAKVHNEYCGHEACVDVCPHLFNPFATEECFLCECKRNAHCNYMFYERIPGLGDIPPV